MPRIMVYIEMTMETVKRSPAMIHGTRRPRLLGGWDGGLGLASVKADWILRSQRLWHFCGGNLYLVGRSLVDAWVIDVDVDMPFVGYIISRWPLKLGR